MDIKKISAYFSMLQSPSKFTNLRLCTYVPAVCVTMQVSHILWGVCGQVVVGHSFLESFGLKEVTVIFPSPGRSGCKHPGWGMGDGELGMGNERSWKTSSGCLHLLPPCEGGIHIDTLSPSCSHRVGCR